MFYRTRKANVMWDTWLYYHDGIHYLYHLHRQNQQLPATTGQRDGITVATSTDGVHFDEIGPIVLKKDDAQRLGTGSVWPVGDRFIMNFCERREGVQAIFFAQSGDLIHWEELGDEYRSDPDPQWYDDTPTGRWDCISVRRRPEGGFVGYFTARPWSRTAGLTYESIGKVESEDGLHWRAVAPPVFDWGEWPAMNLHEPAGIEKIGDLYYLLMGFGFTDDLGQRHHLDRQGSASGMYTFVADSVDGPFRPDTEAFPLLTSNTPPGVQRMTYFARFYRTPEELLVHHHSSEQNDVVWLAPLKRAVVDEDGHLKLGYWKGNDAAKGAPIEVDLSACDRVLPAPNVEGRLPPTEFSSDLRMSESRLEIDEAHGGGLFLLGNHFDLEQGVILEGTLEVHEPAKRWSGIGVFVEEVFAQNRGTAVFVQTRGRTEIGRMNQGAKFLADDVTEKGIAPGKPTTFRLLLRHSLLEFYLDDMLIQAYSRPMRQTGRVGLVFESGRAVFQDLNAWVMT